MIYLDSSALLKLLFEERESGALVEWLASHTVAPLSSELARVEVLRATRRLDPNVLPAARTLLGQLDLVPLTTEVLNLAAEVGEALLRSLDALHLASAVSLGADVTAFIAYDHRLAEAASDAGMQVLQPGR